MTIPSNPFLLVYDKIFDLLFDGGSNPLADLVKVKNRVSFGSLAEQSRNIKKDNVASADMPELIVVDEGGSLNLHANSSGGQYMQSIGIYISTGDYRYSILASLINWYVWCNLIKWRTELTGLTWNGTPFVKNINIIPVQIGESNPERNRGINGWNVIWRLQIELRIARENLVYEEV